MNNIIKNKPIIFSLILILLANAYTEFPLRDYLSNFMPYKYAFLSSIFILQMSCFGCLFYISHKLNISNLYNLTLSKPVKSLYLIIPFIPLIITNVPHDMTSYISNDYLGFILYCFAFLSTGFFEEILFRGIIFNLINNKFGSTKKGFIFSLFISSFLFGASHIVNFLNGTMLPLNFFNQFIYASILGLLFTAIYLRCNTLIVPILIHGFFDITGCKEYLQMTSNELFLESLKQPPITYSNLITTILIFTPLLIWGLFLLRKYKNPATFQEEIL